MDRPARVQGEKVENPEADITSANFNIWWRKRIGQEEEENQREKANSRCHVAVDMGYTKGSLKKSKRFCLYFGRGSCFKGPNCEFLHRVPTAEDTSTADTAYDCFGRDRFGVDKADMSGRGSFLRENRTLYVGGLKCLHINEMEPIVRRHFGEWGEIEELSLFPDRGFGFITYKYRLNADFAKEAMNGQALEGNEILSVRWAREDTNPAAREKKEENFRKRMRNVFEERDEFDKKLVEKVASKAREKKTRKVKEKRPQIAALAAYSDTDSDS